jgi:hypothetical protein
MALFQAENNKSDVCLNHHHVFLAVGRFPLLNEIKTELSVERKKFSLSSNHNLCVSYTKETYESRKE